MECIPNNFIGNVLDPTDQIVKFNDNFKRGEIVAFYFGAAWCTPCSEFENNLLNLKKAIERRNCALRIVFVSSDSDLTQFIKHKKKLDAYALPFENRREKKKLSNFFHVSSLPVLALVDAESGTVLNPNARRMVLENSDVSGFPWEQREFVQILADGPLTKCGQLIDAAGLEKKYLCLYFTAEWCPPCRRVTPLLLQLASHLDAEEAEGRSKGLCLPLRSTDTEILLISYDRQKEEPDFLLAGASSRPDEETENTEPIVPRELRPSSDWIHLGGGGSAERDPRVKELAHRFGVTQIPHLVVLGPAEDGRRPVINHNAIHDIFMGLDRFPWFPGQVSRLHSGTMTQLVQRGDAFLYLTCIEADIEKASKRLEAAVKDAESMAAGFVGLDDDAVVKQLRYLLDLDDRSPQLVYVDFATEHVTACSQGRDGPWSALDTLPSGDDMADFIRQVEDARVTLREFPEKAKLKDISTTN